MWSLITDWIGLLFHVIIHPFWIFEEMGGVGSDYDVRKHKPKTGHFEMCI